MAAHEQEYPLDGLRNACELRSCVELILGGSNPTYLNDFNHWHLSLNAGTTYKGTPMTTCTLQFWDENIQGSAHYNYHQWVYVNVIRTLVDEGVCPLFLRYLAHGKRCNVTTLQNIVDISAHNGESHPDFIGSGGTYRLLLMEQEGTLTLQSYFDQDKQKILGVNLWGILLHIAIACYALFLAKTAHNNLTSSNVQLVQRFQPTTFQINLKEYTIKPFYEPRIVNFFHANVLRYKPNPREYTNTIIETRDFFNILKEYHSHYKNDKLIRVLSEKKSLDDISSNIHDHNWCADNLYPLPVVIQNIYECCAKAERCDNIFNCSSLLFKEDGRFQRSIALNDALTEQRREQARLEISLNQPQKEVAYLEKIVTDVENAIKKAQDTREGLQYKLKAVSAEMKLAEKRLEIFRNQAQQVELELNSAKKRRKDVYVDNITYKVSLAAAVSLGGATAAYMKFGKKSTSKGKNK